MLVFDQAGNLIRHWGGPGEGYQWPKSEHGIHIDGNEFVWLAGNDKTDGQLLKFTMDGKFVLQIGKPIQGPDSNSTERLGSPADIAVDTAAKEVYAADGYGNRRVVVFDSETGAYKRHWGAYGNRPSDAKTPPYDPASRAVAAIRQSGALHPHLQRRPRLRLRPHQQSAADLPQGRHLRVGAFLRAADPAQRHRV